MRSILTILTILLISAVLVSGVYAAQKIYVVNNSDNTVSVINPVSKDLIATIDVGTSPTGISYNPTDKKAYVVNRGDNTVSVIDTLNHLSAGTVNVGP